LGDAVSAATQPVALVVQQSQSLVTGSQQAQPMQLDAVSVPKQDAPNPAKKAKKADKNPCFRCKQPGHQIDTCTAPVCDICESPNHIFIKFKLAEYPCVATAFQKISHHILNLRITVCKKITV
jgi:hypothetical protein